MNVKETLEMLNQVIAENSELIKNEESTKQFLILPFLRGLALIHIALKRLRLNLRQTSIRKTKRLTTLFH